MLESPQAFLEELAPWVSPTDLPTLLRQPFTLLDHLALTPHGDDEAVSVALSLYAGAGPLPRLAPPAGAQPHWVHRAM